MVTGSRTRPCGEKRAEVRGFLWATGLWGDLISQEKTILTWKFQEKSIRA